MAVVKNLMVRCGADFSALTKATNQAKASVSSLSRSTQSATTSIRKSAGTMQASVSSAGKSASSAFSGVGKAIKVAGIAAAIKHISSGLTDLTKEALGVDAQIANLSRTMGTGKAAFMSWAKTGAAAFGISEQAAVKYGNAYSNLISGFVSDTATSTAYTKQLIEASAVIASRTGRTVEDVNDRIRSGLLGSTEAIEDLGINVNVALLETTDAFQRLANGRSWEKLTFQEQQQVRLFAIMEQSSKKFGSTLAGGGATSLMMLRAQLENLKLEFGRAFAPLAETVIPAVTNFVKVIAEGVRWVSQFFAALRGGAQGAESNLEQAAGGAQSTAAGLKGATDAAKDLKNATAGFDEINVLSSETNTAAGAATSGGGAAPAAIGDFAEPDTSGVKKAADKVKGIFQDVSDYISKKFAPTFSSWRNAFGKLKEPAAKAFDGIKSSISSLWNKTMVPFGAYLGGDFLPNIANSFSQTFAPIFGDVMPVLFGEFQKDFAFACGEIDRVAKDILQPCFEHVKTVATDIFGSIKTSWDEHGNGILSGFEKFKESTRKIWDSVYGNVLKPVFDRIYDMVTWLWDKHLKPLWDNLADFFGAISEFCLNLWNNVLAPLVDFVVTRLGPPISYVIGTISDVIGTLVGIVTDVVGGIIKSFTGLLDFWNGVFTGNWKKAWDGIKKYFSGIWDSIWGIVKGVVNLIIDGLNALWGGIYQAIASIINGIGWVAGFFGDLFGQDWKFEVPKNPPKIPKLATGGLAVGPTMAMIGEGPDREAVLPLNPSVYAEIARGIQDAGSQTNSQIVALLQSILDAVLNMDLTMTMDGVMLARTSDKYFEAEHRRKGAPVVRVV